MIKTHNIDRGAHLHPAFAPIPMRVPVSSAADLVAAIADTTAVVGTALTLVVSGTSGVGPAGWMGAWPCSIACTTGVGVICSFQIVGIDQFGIQRTETLSVTASSAFFSLYAYSRIISITPTVLSASGANFSFGHILTTGCRFALPFQPATQLVGTTTQASFLQQCEFVGMSLAATNNVFLQTASTAIDPLRSTFVLAVTATAGLNWLHCNYFNKGYRQT